MNFIENILSNRKLLFKILVYFSISLTLIIFNFDSYLKKISNNYFRTEKVLVEENSSLSLENIINNGLNKTRNIFFVESSFFDSQGEVSLNNRQACSIESAALMNPKAHISVIFVTSSRLRHSNILKALMEYKNIAFYRIDLLELSTKTPVEEWIKSNQIYETKYLIETISDIVRLLLLWR